MWSPFASKKEPPPPAFDPFEILELMGRADNKVAEMRAADAILTRTIKRAENIANEMKAERERLERVVAQARALPRKASRAW